MTSRGASIFWPGEYRPEEAAPPALSVQNQNFAGQARIGIDCLGCGGPVAQQGSGRPRKFCMECRPSKSSGRIDPQRCAQCGTSLPPRPRSQRGRARIYCGTRCRNRASEARHPDRRAARAKVWNQRAKAARPRWEETCPYCQTNYTTARRRRSCPADECKRRARHDGAVDHHSRRRGKTRGPRIARKAVFERDNWTCQLCRKPITKDLRAPHPMSRSVDHIVPLSRGGLHEMANLQAAHLRCNVRKAARLDSAQRRLM